MKRSDENERLDPDVERELDAIERALAGLEVDEEMAPVATLVADLREERPEPDADWAAELDRRAAAGFGGGSRSPMSERIGGFRVRSLLLPACALATLAVVVGVGVGVTRDGGGGSGNPVKSIQDVPAQGTVSSDSGSAGSGVSGSHTSALPVPAEAATPDFQNLGQLGALPDSASRDQVSPGRTKRQEDRSASLTLRTGTDEAGDVSDQAIQITESAGGVVTSSQLSQSKDSSTAQLELAIPTKNLDATLDRLTDLATVVSLNEASTDITHPFVSAQTALRDARAQRAKLLEALGNASTDTEAAAIRQQLSDVQQEIARDEAAFAKVARQARMADVSLTIEGSASENSKDNGSTLGNAADDALHALETVAAVMLVGAAIVLPVLALVALIAWGAVAWRRRSRERVLDK